MTPGIELARKRGITHIVHEYTHDPADENYGAEAARKLGVPEDRVFKTLVVKLDNNELAVGVLPVSTMLSMKLIARSLGAKKAVMAEKAAVERATGYVLGGVSPLGQRKRLRTVVDGTAMDHATIYISAGRRGLDIELAPEDLLRMIDGVFANICQD